MYPSFAILKKNVGYKGVYITRKYYGDGSPLLLTRVGVIKIVIVINCNLITFFKIIENNCNSVFTLITIIEM